jgi:epoxyqueuosine reductase
VGREGTDTTPTVAELRAVGRAAGLAAVGVAAAEPFAETRAELERRRAEGLHGGMQFTYRNPARSTDPSRALPGVRSLVVGALAYPVSPPVDRPVGPSGRVARYADGDHYGRLRQGLERVAAHLRAAGHRAVIVLDDNALVDRAAAHRAGLGWWGKNANILVPGHGSWVVLGSVLTDADLAAADAPVPDGCGSCTRCLDGCPTGAIVAPGVVDARRCLAWLVQAEGDFPEAWREPLGDRLYGCDVCQEVCPPSTRAGRDEVAVGAPGASRPWVDLLSLLAATDDELLAAHGRWYIPRRDPRYLRRNALVVLGNVGDGSDPRVVALLRRYLDGGDDLLRRHAAWAAGRLGIPVALPAGPSGAASP